MTDSRPSQRERDPNVECHDCEGPLAPVCVGQWCCGCSEHPIGKPWGWNYTAWERHYDNCHPLPPQPPMPEYTDADFA